MALRNQTLITATKITICRPEADKFSEGYKFKWTAYPRLFGPVIENPLHLFHHESRLERYNYRYQQSVL